MTPDVLALIGTIILAGVLVWLIVEIRSLHADLQPLIDSPIAHALSSQPSR